MEPESERGGRGGARGGGYTHLAGAMDRLVKEAAKLSENHKQLLQRNSEVVKFTATLQKHMVPSRYSSST